MIEGGSAWRIAGKKKAPEGASLPGLGHLVPFPLLVVEALTKPDRNLIRERSMVLVCDLFDPVGIVVTQPYVDRLSFTRHLFPLLLAPVPPLHLQRIHEKQT